MCATACPCRRAAPANGVRPRSAAPGEGVPFGGDQLRAEGAYRLGLPRTGTLPPSRSTFDSMSA